MSLQDFADNIWIASGPVVTAAAGFRYPTRMAVIRLSGGRLFIWSPVALDAALRSQIDALGTVAHIVAPNGLHDCFLAEWAAAYPDASLHATPALADRRPDLRVDAKLGDAPDPGWAEQIDQVVVRGNLITVEVVFFHRESHTVLFTDLLQQLPPDWFTGWRGIVARLDLMTGPRLAVPRKFRLAFRDRLAARRTIGTILAWPVQRILVAHGPPVTSQAETALRGAFRWLIR